jgi:predicted metal-dependent hydrolase
VTSLAADGQAPWNGDHLRTRLLDAISLMLPAGEEFVIGAVADWLRDDTRPAGDQALRKEAQRFIDEERAHQRAHRLYNLRLARHGLPAMELEQRVRMAVAELAPLSLQTRLALAAAFEHLTALLSREMLAGRPWLCAAGDCPQARLWRWHCAEEIGHHRLVPELVATSRVGHLRRVGCLLLASGYLGIDVARLLLRLLAHDLRVGELRHRALAGQACRFAVAALPGVLRMALGWCRYLAPVSSTRPSGV